MIQEIQNRCRIRPGMLVMVNPREGMADIPARALVHRLSPGCDFTTDYEGAEEHIFYICQPLDGTPEFCDYVCNMQQIS